MRITEIVTASPYNAGFAAAATLGIVLAIRSGRDRQFAPAAWYAILASALAAGIIGSKLIFLDFEPIAPGEKTVLGGLILGILTALAVATTVRINAWRALDAMTVPTLAAMAVGRVGCFLAGCCAGTHSDLPWAVTSPRHGADVHPVQLYEAAADVLLIFALRRSGASKRDGQHFLLATLGYIGIRIATEFVRDGRSLYGPLNLVQWSLLAIGIVLTWVAIRRAQAVGVAVQLPPVANHPTPAVGAALGIAITVWLAGTWFVPLEQLVLLVLAAALALVAAVSVLPRRAWRLGVVSGSLSNQGNQASASVLPLTRRVQLRWAGRLEGFRKDARRHRAGRERALRVDDAVREFCNGARIPHASQQHQIGGRQLVHARNYEADCDPTLTSSKATPTAFQRGRNRHFDCQPSGATTTAAFSTSETSICQLIKRARDARALFWVPPSRLGFGLRCFRVALLC